MVGRVMAQLKSLNRERLHAAVNTLAATGSEHRAMDAGGFGRVVLNKLLDGRSPRFKAAWEDAKARSNDMLEQEARRRAVEGVERKKFHQGEEVQHTVIVEGERVRVPYTEREYSDRMLEVILKANMPEKYGDKSKVEHSGEVGVEAMTPEEREARIQAIALKAAEIIKQTR